MTTACIHMTDKAKSEEANPVVGTATENLVKVCCCCSSAFSTLSLDFESGLTKVIKG